MTEENQAKERIIPRLIEQEMRQSYLGYSMSVIVGRALPVVRDGLKPVHRRILFAMWSEGLLHNKRYSKCAGIVGEVLKKYHPHGDMAVYDALVRLAQPWNMRYPLVDGQGNFGSVDGDSAAAYRYTEARLTKLAEEMLQDIDKETVEFIANFDGSAKEPIVLPSKVPNLLLNGSAGIAVGMATNIPPHNMNELCDGIIKVIDEPEIDVLDLLKTVKGPDFPTGGIIMGQAGIRQAYLTGKGRVKVRARSEIEETKNKTRIIITEIPYMVNKAHLIEMIADLVRDKKVQGIADLRDESDRDGMRVVVELKQGANAEIVLNQLYAHSRLQDTFSINLLGLVDNQPKVLSLKDIIFEYITHRKEIIRKRTQYDLTQAENRAHLLEGLLIALDHIDAVVQLIKKSESAEAARTSLMEDYKLSERQAQAILDMTLRRLTGLEQEKLRNEHKELLEKIKELKDILAHETKILGIIKTELTELKDTYGDERRSQLLESEAMDIDDEALIKPEDCVVTITHAGYVKRLPLDTYKQQRRGGRGIIAAEAREDDFVEKVFVANTHDYLLCFTSFGKVHWVKVYQLPEAGRYAKGSAIVNLVQLAPDEKVTTYITVKEFTESDFLFMVTKQGTVKKTPLAEFSNPRRGGIIALGLGKGDELKKVMLTDGQQNILIATKDGSAVKFKEEDVRPMGRTATGVRGIRLREGDLVVGAAIAEDDKTLLTVTSKGFGKRTKVEEYRLTARGGVGVTNIKITEKNGEVVGIQSVTDDDELMLISQKGVLIRTPAKGIGVIGRSTQGVRIMRLGDDDQVIGVATIAPEE